MKVAQAQVARAKSELSGAVHRRRQHGRAGVHVRAAPGSSRPSASSSPRTPTPTSTEATEVQQAARRQSTTLRNAQLAQLKVAQAEARLSQQQAAAAAATARMREHRDQVNAALADTQKVLSQLKAEERQRLADQGRRASGQPRWRPPAPRSAQPRHHSERGRAGNAGGGTYDGPASGRAAVAVRYALSQVGDPYSYSANPPSSWDCSKLTAAAWRAAGVSLTPLSYAQANQVRRISTSDLQPGDLLFYFRGAHHVAMYIGGGRLVEAASPSHGVWVTDVWNSWSRAHFSFAGRVVG